MPIYEYQCEKCEHEFDTLQKLSEKPLKKCPECGTMSLTKLVSAAGFRLKGGGWYETDFKSGKKKNLANSDESGGKSSTNNSSAASGGTDKSASQEKKSSAGKKKSGAAGKSASN